MMMTLRDVHLQRHYDPAHDGTDLIKEFYLPCLSVSNRYDRISPYFSSALLKSFSIGLHYLFANGGKIRFIFSYQLDQSDRENIEEGYRKRRNQRAESIDSRSSLLASDFEVANLGYLIEHGLADVKIAFRVREEASILHIKSGLFSDKEGNKVYFSGSGNETINGTRLNAEEFTVFASYLSEEQKQDTEFGENQFNLIWNNEYSSSVRTFYPIGNLFEKLKSFSKGKIFHSKDEFCNANDCVFIDIDKEKGCILLSDLTIKQLLGNRFVLQTYRTDNWVVISKGQYRISRLSLHILRDLVIRHLEQSKVAFVLSSSAEEYLNKHNLDLSQRVNLGLAIKENREQELWGGRYAEFSNVVNNERQARLKERQRQNAFYHYNRISSMDFSVPGTGKTYISYGLFAYLSSKKINQCTSLVVFGPLNCFKAWKEEGKAIFGNKRELLIFDLTQHRDDYKKTLARNKYSLYLFNYDFLGNGNDWINEKIKVLSEEVLSDKTMVVFDEIHKLKSLDGVTSRNFIRLMNDCKDKPVYRLALTGTPLPNSFCDLFNYLRLLYTDDIEQSFSMLSPSRLKASDGNPFVAEKTINSLLPYFVRTTKKELNVPLPDPDDNDSLCVTPTEGEEKLYQLIWKYIQNPLLKYIRLIQASSNPLLLKRRISMEEMDRLYDDDNKQDFGHLNLEESSLPEDELNQILEQGKIASKRQATIDKIKTLVSQGRKVLVWCLFIDTIDYLSSALTSFGIRCTTICGRDDVFLRDNKINDFKYSGTQVLITNPNTLAESVSLHRVCHDAIYLEYGFNLTYRLQSKDRINRVGLEQGTHTHYYYAISKSCSLLGPIDNLILDRLNRKAERRLSTIESGKLAVIGDKESRIEDIKYILSKGM